MNADVGSHTLGCTPLRPTRSAPTSTGARTDSLGADWWRPPPHRPSPTMLDGPWGPKRRSSRLETPALPALHDEVAPRPSPRPVWQRSLNRESPGAASVASALSSRAHGAGSSFVLWSAPRDAGSAAGPVRRGTPAAYPGSPVPTPGCIAVTAPHRTNGVTQDGSAVSAYGAHCYGGDRRAMGVDRRLPFNACVGQSPHLRHLLWVSVGAVRTAPLSRPTCRAGSGAPG